MVLPWFSYGFHIATVALFNSCPATGFSAGIALGVGLGLSAGLAAIFIATGEEGALPPVDHLKNIYMYNFMIVCV